MKDEVLGAALMRRLNPRLEFTLDESGKAKELVIEPGGVFTKRHRQNSAEFSEKARSRP